MTTICRGTSGHCDLPYWTAQTILNYAANTEKVLDDLIRSYYLVALMIHSI